MGLVRKPADVCLIAAVCYAPDISIGQLFDELEGLWGSISKVSDTIDFSHTNYYESEMGKHLSKCYLAFENLIEPMQIVDTKHQSNQLEHKYAIDSRRKINIDPGYIEAPKLVLATTKNFAHRIYLGKGIYGDVQLIWRGGRFMGNPWTYPDYLDARTLAFFTGVRTDYMKRGAGKSVDQL